MLILNKSQDYNKTTVTALKDGEIYTLIISGNNVEFYELSNVMDSKRTIRTYIDNLLNCVEDVDLVSFMLDAPMSDPSLNFQKHKFNEGVDQIVSFDSEDISIDVTIKKIDILMVFTDKTSGRHTGKRLPYETLKKVITDPLKIRALEYAYHYTNIVNKIIIYKNKHKSC